MNLTEWQKAAAESIAAFYPLTPTTPIKARGNSLVAQNDEPEPFTEAQLLAADKAEPSAMVKTCREADRAQVAELNRMPLGGFLA